MHTEPAASAVIFVLLDAFRHDYLGRTRFLREIAARSIVGRLEEPFGFCPRGAYFGGLSMAEQGYTNLFRLDPENSVFRWTRQLTGTGHDPLVRERLLPEIGAHARALATPFAACYLNPLDIPLDWLGYFDACEQEGPASPRVGYRSLFHILEEAGRSWVDVSWPYPGWTGELSSARAVGFALEQWKARHEFAFIHLPDLDLKGHPHGPGSPEIQASLEETDRLCELICARALELYRDPVILFAGDHGMLPVVRTVDVAGALAATGLRFGHDLAYFIDSTMVRCWFFTEHARRTAWAALAAAGGGHVVSEDERRRWGLTGIDPRSGEDIFLADPGVLFSPNFFDWTGRSQTRGMHGYAPEVSDNQAIFLAHRPHRSCAGEVGTVQARRLFPTLLQWLGYDSTAFTPVSPVRIEDTAPARARWSVNGSVATDAVVEDHLARIVRGVRERTPAVEAVVVAGGFGRGEGTIVRDAVSGRPVNDYDVVVVGGDGAALDGLGSTLARQLGIDFVELWGRASLTAPERPSQFDFDLRYGSRLLWGNPLVVDRLPRYAPSVIGVDEGVVQIGNRCGGMLLGLSGVGQAADSPEQFLGRQAGKFLIAIADCWLMAQGDYHPSYVLRRTRFRDLAAGVFSGVVLDAIDAAFLAKLEGIQVPRTCAPCLVSTANAALDDLERLLGWVRSPGALASAISAAAPRRVRSTTDWLPAARARGLSVTGAYAHDGPACVAAIYRGCLEGVRAWSDTGLARATRVTAALAPQFDAAPLTDARLLPAVAETWLSFFH